MKIGKTLLVVCSTSFCILMAQARAQSADPEALAEFATTWIETERGEAEIPGVIAALVVDGEVVLARGWGEADGDTRFRVGSISKPVTATAALLAMAEFGVAPDDDLRELFGALPIRPPLTTPLSFHDLLTQTGGFGESLSGQHVTDPDEFLSLEDYLRRHLPPRFEAPGQVITYNDHHTALAGFAVEQLAGAPFAEYVATRLFGPLGMDHSTFDQIDIVESATMPLAQSYHLVNGDLVPYERDLIMTTPAAGLATTATDMGRYLSFLLDPDAPLLPAALHERQRTVQFRNDPRLRGRGYGFAEASQGGHLVLYKDGQANGFGARMVIVPEFGIGIFVAVNRSVLGPMGRRNAAGDFLRDFTGAVLSEAITPLTAFDAPEMLQGVDSRAFAGTYRTTVAARHTWELLLAMTDTARVKAHADGAIDVGSGRYVPVDEGLYQWHEGGPFYVAFEHFAEGGPDYLIIGSGSYERVPWYGVQEGASAIILGVAAIAFLMLIGGGFAFARGRGARWSGLAMVGSVVRLGAIGMLAGTLVLMDPQGLFYGMPPSVALAVGLALLAPTFDGLALLSAMRRRPESLSAIMVALIYFVSTAVFIWWLDTWNLLGWHI